MAIVRALVIGGCAIAAVALAQEGGFGASSVTVPARLAVSDGPRLPAPHPVLVELFTSQGCSSCPPADAVLASLETRHDVVALSRHVTYWDRIGWRDTHGRPANDLLQRRYAARGIADGGVFTPELVVNGAAGAIGSHGDEARALISRAARQPAAVLLVAGGAVATAAPVARASELRFMAVAAHRRVAIGAGELNHRTLDYANVVLAEASEACVPEQVCRAAVPSAIRRMAGADRFAVVLQEADGGAVLAAQWLPAGG